MVDDHPSMLEGYKIILSYNTLGYEIETTTAYNCETALSLIRSNKFDVIFLDYSLPPFEEENITSGIDLAKIVRKVSPKTKIVILTSHSESIILCHMVSSVDPEGLLVKSDFSADDLISAFSAIMNGEIYYSITAKSRIKELGSKRTYLDNSNRQIITLLAQGVKTKSLPNHLNLSISSIEKRKIQIKDYLSIEKGTDEDIIREAKKLGLI